MTDVAFNPSSWHQAGQRTTRVRSQFQAGSQRIIFPPVSATDRSSSPIDKILALNDRRLLKQWYDACGNMVEKLNSDASKFKATGVTYQSTANTAQNAVTRFWSY